VPLQRGPDLKRLVESQGRGVRPPAGIGVEADPHEVVTSARRFRRGLLHTLIISYGYYYALSSVVNRIAGRRVIGVAPAVRSAVP